VKYRQNLNFISGLIDIDISIWTVPTIIHLVASEYHHVLPDVTCFFPNPPRERPFLVGNKTIDENP
jgi:hypothetical protein